MRRVEPSKDGLRVFLRIGKREHCLPFASRLPVDCQSIASRLPVHCQSRASQEPVKSEAIRSQWDWARASTLRLVKACLLLYDPQAMATKCGGGLKLAVQEAKYCHQGARRLKAAIAQNRSNRGGSIFPHPKQDLKCGAQCAGAQSPTPKAQRPTPNAQRPTLRA